MKPYEFLRKFLLPFKGFVWTFFSLTKQIIWAQLAIVIDLLMIMYVIIEAIWRSFIPKSRYAKEREDMIILSLANIESDLEKFKVKVCVALIHPDGEIPFRRTLKVDYYTSKMRNRAETYATFRRGEGPPGLAWKHRVSYKGQARQYGRRTKEKLNLTDMQVALTRQITSSLAIPLFKQFPLFETKTVFGVLCLLCEDNVNHVFTHEKFRRYVAIEARSLEKMMVGKASELVFE